MSRISAALVFVLIAPFAGRLNAAVPDLLILEPAVDAKTDPNRARVMTERLTEVLRKGRFVRPRAAKAPCETGDCALKIARETGSARVLLSRISKPGREYRVETDFIHTESGQREIRASIRLPSLENRDMESGVAALAREIQSGLKKAGYRPERILSWDDHARALVPGLTQYRRGQKRWSYFLAGSSLFLLQRYMTRRAAWLQARSDFQDPFAPIALAIALRNQPGAGAAASNLYTGTLRDRAEARGRELNLTLLLLGGLLVWNYLDAVNDYRYFHGGTLFSNKRAIHAPGAYGTGYGDGRRDAGGEFRLGLTWRFEF